MSAFITASEYSPAPLSPFLRAATRKTFNAAGSKASSWTAQQDQLRSMWTSGASLNEMSEALERTPSAILTQAARMGLPRRSHSGRKNTDNSLKARNVLNFSSSKRVARVRDYYDSEPKATSPRKCLMCRDDFPSTGAGHRICDKCKCTQRYQSSSSGFDGGIYIDAA